MPNFSDYSLRPFERRYLEKVLEWRNSDHVRAYMYRDDPISLEDHLRWYERVMSDKSCDYRLFYYQNTPVGLTSATQIDNHSRKCFWGLYVGDQGIPAGSGTWLGYHSLNHMMQGLGMRKVICEAFAFNTRALNLYKKLGFGEEGCFKRHVLKSGRYEDVVSLALFDDEWHSVKAQLIQGEKS